MELTEKNKYPFSVFLAALLFSQILFVSNICAHVYGTRYISYEIISFGKPPAHSPNSLNKRSIAYNPTL